MAEQFDNETYESYVEGMPQVPWQHYLIPLALFIIVFVGVSGNSLVLFVIVKHRDMRTVTNYFVGNLAITDISLLLICALPTALILCGWQMGEFICRSTSYMQSVTVQATCLTLTVMTIDRYNLIVHAVKSRNTRTTTRAAVFNIFIWIFSFLVHIPAFVGTRKVDSECKRKFKHDDGPLIHYVIGNFFLMYALPLTVIVFCYIKILVQVWRKTSEGTESAQAQARALRRKKKITKMVFIVVVLFAICWAPLHVVNTVVFVNLDSPAPQVWGIIHICTLLLAYTNSIVNPFVYAFATTSFKKYFHRVFAPCRCGGVGGEMMTSVSISMKTKSERLSVTQNGASKDDSSI
ncbi:G-protein coupled receptor 54 [Holothuria leucospilota]|uniref:G-protein coupled receptor 54 n=1 Tax=Holothuria leucospilota TaxID=206669 RepID=A0A9Q1BM04_HOLLE|nr:G-protein coupled receptor 54 [Holothuria leucospilota]